MRVRRREFFRRIGGVAMGGALLWPGGCRRSGSPTGPVTSGAWDARVAALQVRIPELMRQSAVPGLGIALIRDAAVAWHRGFGVVDRDSNVPVDDATRFEAASMSKPVFAYVVMKLCERGILDLDTPLVDYGGDRFLLREPRLALITARHVLSQTSGFQNIRSGSEPLAIRFRPGEKWAYSGEGFAYLQSVVTHLAGHVNPTDCGTFEADLKVCATETSTHSCAPMCWCRSACWHPAMSHRTASRRT